MSALARRKVLLGGAALAVAALGVSVTPRAASAADNEHLMDLWRRFIAAEVHFADAISVQDLAEWGAKQELTALVCPWTPMGEEDFEHKAVEVSRRRIVIEKAAGALTMRVGGLGPWLVWEYQPRAADHPFVNGRRDGNRMRWQPYPEAASADEAYATAVARAEKEWRSFDGKRSAISRKHQVRKFKAGVNAASDACGLVRHDIASAPVTGALAIAIKLGLWGYGTDMDYKSAPSPLDHWDHIEAAALASLYKHAVSESGFDPLALAREAMRKHEKVLASRERA